MRVERRAPTPDEQWNWEWSPDEFFEPGVLMRGIRKNVEVVPASEIHYHLSIMRLGR